MIICSMPECQTAAGCKCGQNVPIPADIKITITITPAPKDWLAEFRCPLQKLTPINPEAIRISAE